MRDLLAGSLVFLIPFPRFVVLHDRSAGTVLASGGIRPTAGRGALFNNYRQEAAG
jgi:hypothetical protein